MDSEREHILGPDFYEDYGMLETSVSTIVDKMEVVNASADILLYCDTVKSETRGKIINLLGVSRISATSDEAISSIPMNLVSSETVSMRCTHRLMSWVQMHGFRGSFPKAVSEAYLTS
jgi:hypothetical protein